MLMQNLFLCFDSQQKLISTSTYEKFRGEVRKLEQKSLDDIADKLAKILDALVEASMASYTKKVEGLVIEGSGWDHKITLAKRDL